MMAAQAECQEAIFGAFEGLLRKTKLKVGPLWGIMSLSQFLSQC